MNFEESQEVIKDARNIINRSKNIVRSLLSELANEIDNLNHYTYSDIQNLRRIKRKLKKFNSRNGKWIKN